MIPEDHDIYQESERQKLFRVTLFPILGIQNSVQSDAVLTCSFGVLEGRGAASSNIPVNVEI